MLGILLYHPLANNKSNAAKAPSNKICYIVIKHGSVNIWASISIALLLPTWHDTNNFTNMLRLLQILQSFSNMKGVKSYVRERGNGFCTDQVFFSFTVPSDSSTLLSISFDLKMITDYYVEFYIIEGEIDFLAKYQLCRIRHKVWIMFQNVTNLPFILVWTSKYMIYEHCRGHCSRNANYVRMHCMINYDKSN